MLRVRDHDGCREHLHHVLNRLDRLDVAIEDRTDVVAQTEQTLREHDDEKEVRNRRWITKCLRETDYDHTETPETDQDATPEVNMVIQLVLTIDHALDASLNFRQSSDLSLVLTEDPNRSHAGDDAPEEPIDLPLELLPCQAIFHLARAREERYCDEDRYCHDDDESGSNRVVRHRCRRHQKHDDEWDEFLRQEKRDLRDLGNPPRNRALKLPDVAGLVKDSAESQQAVEESNHQSVLDPDGDTTHESGLEPLKHGLNDQDSESERSLDLDGASRTITRSESVLNHGRHHARLDNGEHLHDGDDRRSPQNGAMIPVREGPVVPEELGDPSFFSSNFFHRVSRVPFEGAFSARG